MKLLLSSIYFLFSCSLLLAEEEKLKTSDEHFEQGIQSFDQQSYSEALSHFEKAELESEYKGKVYFNQARCHEFLNEQDLAEKAYQKALQSNDPFIEMKSCYNLGHLLYQWSLKKTTDANNFEIDEEKFKSSLNYFRDVGNYVDRVASSEKGEAETLHKKAKENEKLLMAKYKAMLDEANKKKGKKVPLLKGQVQVNGRPGASSFVFLKSKWDDHILEQTKSDSTGAYTFPDLDLGKYQVAAALYASDEGKELSWNTPVKVMSYEKDTQTQSINGPLSLGCPYQSSVPTMSLPYNDSSRASGPDSITSSTDWGELTDGRPAETFPEENDADQGYVAFSAENFQFAIALPQAQQQHQQQQIQKSTEPQEPPTYELTLKGYHNGKDAVLPEQISIFGMKKDLEKPIKLFETVVLTTDTGRYEWKSEAFVYKDCRQLILNFKRNGGQRISLHEIEIHENLNQKSDQQQQDQKNDQQQKNDSQSQQRQPKKDKKSAPKKNASRPVKAILDKIRKKNKDSKKQQATGVIQRTARDY